MTLGKPTTRATIGANSVAQHQITEDGSQMSASANATISGAILTPRGMPSVMTWHEIFGPFLLLGVVTRIMAYAGEPKTTLFWCDWLHTCQWVN